MKPPKAKVESREIDTDSEDWTLTGPNTELLSVRIPKGLYRELEFLAKQSKRQLPEVIRELLWVHAFPIRLQDRLQTLKDNLPKGPDGQAMFYYSSLLPQLQMYQHQVEKLLVTSERVRAVQDNAMALTARLKELEAEAKTEWQKFLDSTT